MNLHPRGLFGRLVAILVAGMLAAQFFTSTIWYDARRNQLFEIPTRLLAARLADTVDLLDGAAPAEREHLLQSLDTPGYRLGWARSAPVAGPRPPRDVARLLAADTARQLGRELPMQVLDAELVGDRGSRAGLYDFFFARHPEGRYRVRLQLADGSWLQVDATTGQAGLPFRPRQVIVDYLLRIYLLRMLVIVLIVLLAARWLLKPLARLAQAAETLGHDIHSPPMPVRGPAEVRQAAQAFNLMQRRLIDALRERGRILAAVSHDLRSPITRLRLRTELLDDAALQAAFRQDLDHMEAAVAATLELTRDAWQDERRQLIAVDALLASLQADFAETGVQVGVAGSAAPFAGYPRSLRRCLGNLLDNAVRYGRDVRIQVEDAAGALTLAVLDRGPGIAEAELARAAEPYYRGEPARAAHAGGSGLGLSIAAAIAAGHRGRLDLRNRVGGGLAATLWLPRG